MSRLPRPPHPDRTVSHGERRAVVGWTHNDLPRGIDLCIESAASQAGLENDRIARDHFALTHNQALLLARYLLQSTGQRIEEPSRGLLRRIFRRN